MPPWLKPTIATRCPLRAAIARIAPTTYSAETWMSLIAWFGSVTAQYGRSSAAKARS